VIARDRRDLVRVLAFSVKWSFDQEKMNKSNRTKTASGAGYTSGSRLMRALVLAHR